MVLNTFYKGLIAKEISKTSRYMSCVIRWHERAPETSHVIDHVECKKKITTTSIEELKSEIQKNEWPVGILIDGNFNHSFDIQADLNELCPHLKRNSRVFVVAYNPYLAWLYKLANLLHLRKDSVPTTFITKTDLKNLVSLSGFEVIRIRTLANFPFQWLGIGSLLNLILSLIPIVRQFSLAHLITLRPIIRSEKRPSLTVLIPARNEKGNIQPALDRMPDLGCDLEVLFVEGNSTDGTWEEIQAAIQRKSYPFKIRALKQTGRGKADAVRTGFRQAQNDLLTILDADLTMPPELLERFYTAYLESRADFINGSRLVYPMEGEAMRFLNWLGNIFFAKALSLVLDTPIGDSLCGTKLVSRIDYQRFMQWREEFGNFDPFGDFELIFPAAELGLGVIDIPIRYRARTYGETNIHRFRDGFVLLRMTLLGLWKIKWGLSR